ncbi:MAG: nucleoside triphosphate pyrophosphohydrolase [Candidatus Kaelpia aquatica]|nr:nucleoside triphosphate pyrophosphohydrolase [Candidatus Kaelpia aquatica]
MDKINELWNIVKRLRGEKGCPWDKEQNEKTLLPYLIEEVYEVAKAVEEDDKKGLLEELGDLLFTVLSYLHIAEEKKYFLKDEVIDRISKKMIERHPHVFSNKDLKTSDDVLAHWYDLKNKEAKKKDKSILDNVPKNISSLVRAKLIQARASRVGFDWKEPKEAFKKVKEEILEVEEHLDKENEKDRLSEEFGDLFFALVNVCRILKIDPEIKLRDAIDKFTKRFNYIEEKMKERDKSLYDATLAEMEELWIESKSKA